MSVLDTIQFFLSGGKCGCDPVFVLYMWSQLSLV